MRVVLVSPIRRQDSAHEGGVVAQGTKLFFLPNSQWLQFLFPVFLSKLTMGVGMAGSVEPTVLSGAQPHGRRFLCHPNQKETFCLFFPVVALTPREQRVRVWE